MKIGVLYCGYNTLDYVEESLRIWIDLKAKHSIIISAVSAPFQECPDEWKISDGTDTYLRKLWESKQIDYFFDEPKFTKECVLRTTALTPLLQEDVDFVWIVDSDEFYTEQEIVAIIDFLQTHEAATYAVPLKNYVGDTQTYLPFPLTKIFNNRFPSRIDRFYWDGEVFYDDGQDCKHLPKIVIPRDIAFVRHYAWLANERSRLKIEYQQKHFGRCSYRWNNGMLEINDEYYRITGEPYPILHKDV